MTTLPTSYVYMEREMWSEKVGNDVFCSKCLSHERFFTGGHSWSPDLCPCGCEDTIVWHKMNIWQKRKARKKYTECEKVWQRRLEIGDK